MSDFLKKYGHCQVALRDEEMHPEYVTVQELYEAFAMHILAKKTTKRKKKAE